MILFELDETTINQLAKSSELVLSRCQLYCTHEIDCDILQKEDECRSFPSLLLKAVNVLISLICLFEQYI